MTRLHVAPIVEGHGEVPAVPALLRRIATELLDVPIEVERPWRVPKGKMVKADELGRVVAVLRARVGTPGLVLVIVDSDRDDPVALHDAITEAARQPIACVVAVQEFEAWFLAAQPPSAVWDPTHAEEVVDAKGRLVTVTGREYREVRDQAGFASTFDLAAAQTYSTSFSALVTCLREASS